MFRYFVVFKISWIVKRRKCRWHNGPIWAGLELPNFTWQPNITLQKNSQSAKFTFLQSPAVRNQFAHRILNYWTDRDDGG